MSSSTLRDSEATGTFRRVAPAERPRAFVEVARRKAAARPPSLRVRDWSEFHPTPPDGLVHEQAARCMGCGVPTCHAGCPLGNVIPEWNDAVWRGDVRAGAQRLLHTNNFPEFTGRLCPAPCEEACVLRLHDAPVTIKQVERYLADHLESLGLLEPRPAARPSGRRVAVVGSGPAGLAAAQQLARAGHEVVVFERADRPGGLLRYGIPDFKLDRTVLDRRLAQLEGEGVRFVTGVEVGGPDAPVEVVLRTFDAVCLATGATRARDLNVPGRHLGGVHFAMEYLEGANRVVAGDLAAPPIDAAGKAVVVLGGGDTGADCVATALRQGATRVVQLEILEAPPSTRPVDPPWPWWPRVLRRTDTDEEGGERDYGVETTRFVEGPGGRVRAVETHRVEWVEGADGRVRPEPVEGAEPELIPADLVLLALGFEGPDRRLFERFDVHLTPRGLPWTSPDWTTNVPGVFACGDCRRGASLVVWAIWEGRECARAVDRWLRGHSALPSRPGPLERYGV